MLVVRLIGVLLFAGFIACAIASSIVISDMIEEINAASEDRENPMFGYLGKLRRIRRKYRALCPTGTRDKLLDGLMISGLVLLVCGAGLMLLPR